MQKLMQLVNAKDLDVVIPIYNLIQCLYNYSKTSESLWQYHRDESDDTAIANSELLESRVRITGITIATDNTNDVEIAVPLKNLSNFWRTLKMLLLILTWSEDCVISAATGAT